METMTKCIWYSAGLYEIKLVQQGRSFAVVYGKQVTTGLDYSHACTQLGAAIMHRAVCEGAFEVEEDSSVKRTKSGKLRFEP